MKQIYTLLLLAIAAQSEAQQSPLKIDDVQFFKNESVLPVTITTDIRRMMSGKLRDGGQLPANFSFKLEDGTNIQEPITLETRGNFRKNFCHIPPLKANFKTDASPYFSPLGSLKLVNICKVGTTYDEFLLKEYLIYKIYNLLTERSLRARLLRINYVDSARKKTISTYGFLLEDVKDMAKRNGCVERKRRVNHTELADRKQMTQVALFEYMIANLDWSVPVRHNIKLIVPKEDTNALPFAVPYDFDHSGFVKAEYALPPPEANLESVTQRNYRGFVRSIDELQEAANDFLKQKDAIYNLVREFDLLSANTRSEAIDFLDDFFDTISQPKELKAQFILNARRQ